MMQNRTHTCGELRAEHAGQHVQICGWMENIREVSANLAFLVLRDFYGTTQVVVESEEMNRVVSELNKESVLCVKGTVRERSSKNPNMPTGDIEVVPESIEVLGRCRYNALPFQINHSKDADEAIRLKYRYLDLRNPEVKKNIVLRSKVVAALRSAMADHDFMEITTPILTASSPEGARDYLVPARKHPGMFYALPQAPQQFKQLLMTSGFDRYFQIAPCFRDEDARADRSPGEFYQLDVEMSFVEQDDIFAVIEGLLEDVFGKFSTKEFTHAPFPRIPYREAMRRFGSDKPDLRNPLEMIDVSEQFRDCGFKAFAGVVANGGVVRAIKAPKVAGKPRKFFDDMIKFAQENGAKGMAYIIWSEEGEKSPIVKFLTPEILAALKTAGGVETGDALFFLADAEKLVQKIGGAVIPELGRQLELIDPNVFKFCWIVDFPMFEEDEETGATVFSHNPFSMPQGGMDALLNKNPLDILAYQYDIVCNGIELSSGAIRNHQPEVMYKAFEIAGYDRSVVDDKFGGMINAFKLGAPPHGGIAPGVDRMVMLLADEPNIREVIAFPFNQQAQDLMMNAPAEVSIKQLRELHIEVKLPKKQEKPVAEAN